MSLILAASAARAVTVSAPYLVKDINTEATMGSEPSQMTAVGDTLFFATETPKALWKTDGTTEGTVRVAERGGIRNPIAFGDLLAFGTLSALWTSDGTAEGTRLIAPLALWYEGIEPSSITSYGDALFIVGCTPKPNRTCGLWRSDGTPEGTTLVNALEGAYPSTRQITTFRGMLLLLWGQWAWISDGTAEGTRRIVPTGPEAPFLRAQELRITGDLALFTSACYHGRPCYLWRTDGTDEGTFAIATLYESYYEDNDLDMFYPTVLPSVTEDGTFLVCIEDDRCWCSDGTVEGTGRTGTPPCSGISVGREVAEVGGIRIFGTGGVLWRSDGTPEGLEMLFDIQPRPKDVQVLGHTSEVALFAVRTVEGATELWQTDGTAAGTVAVSPMPTVGLFDYDDDDDTDRVVRPVAGTVGNTVFFSGCTPDLGCEPWAITIFSPSTTTTTTSTSTTTSTTLPRHAEGVILADVSVLKKHPNRTYGDDDLLQVDRKSPKQTFIRAQVTGLGDQPLQSATLRLQVVDRSLAASKSGGRIHLIRDCNWDELTTTWKNRPSIDSDPLDTKGAVVRGQIVDFDVTKAIAGDGVYCFALDSLSRNRVEYYSREAEAGVPEMLLIPADPSAWVGIVVADASVRETQPDRNLGRSAMLRVDGKSVKRTFLRVRVRGFDAALVRGVRLRLQVDDGKSAQGPAGRLYEVNDCTWDELTVTYDTQPDIDEPLLDELDEIVRSGDVVDFDITPAITGDGDYCFALESSSRDGVTYRSREATVGGPVIVTTNIAATP